MARIRDSGEDALPRVEQSEAAWPSTAWSPATDVLMTDEAVIVRVELAGVTQGDVRVRATNREVLVTGVRPEPTGPRPTRIDRMEFSFGPFARMIPLPEPVQPDAAEARLTDGLLEIVLPLADSIEPAGSLDLSIIVISHDS